jgi:type II secretory pathway pseudopilin PulG
MRCDLKLRNYKIARLQNSSRGYILITLMLFFALLAIAALAVLPDIVHQIKRDREEEMRHRGTEYMRAIKKYYKKFGRYPSRLEELESTNNLRFLRKRYKDPINNKDFKLLHLGDPSLNFAGVGQGLGQGLGQGQGARQGFVGAPGGGVRQAGPGDANVPQVTGLPQQNTGTPTPAGGDSENPDAQADSKTSETSTPNSTPGAQVFGGGPILGVASVSKAKTIREFNKKNHYNDWLFIYDPSSDRGGLLNGPYQPSLGQGFGGPGQTGITGQGMPNQGQGGGVPPQPGPGQEPPEE